MEYDHKEFPKLVGPRDYWAQVKRTVNGRPVSDADIAQITAAIRGGLQLHPGGADRLLDLGCGNGALTSLLYDSLESMVGVDFSEVLIEVAQRDFQVPGRFEYRLADALAFVQQEPEPERVQKVLMYGCFAYFPAPEATLTTLRERFTQVSRVFIGNMPDLSLAEKFYYNGVPPLAELRDPESKIGVWWTEAEFRALAASCGWSASFSRMPAGFYASHYRYDVVLTPA